MGTLSRDAMINIFTFSYLVCCIFSRLLCISIPAASSMHPHMNSPKASPQAFAQSSLLIYLYCLNMTPKVSTALIKIFLKLTGSLRPLDLRNVNTSPVYVGISTFHDFAYVNLV